MQKYSKKLSRPQRCYFVPPAGFTNELLLELKLLWGFYLDFLKGLNTTKAIDQPQFYIKNRLVYCDGIPFDFLVFSLIHMRVGRDVRLIIQKFRTKDFTSLRAGIEETDFEPFFGHGKAVELKTDSNSSKIFHEGAIYEIVKNVLDKKNCKIDENAEDRTRVYVNLIRDVCYISVSLAGNPLYKRGYKSQLNHNAPLLEDLAHGCIFQCFEKFSSMVKPAEVSNLVVPFCGSGTLVAESILFLSETSTYLNSTHFSYQDFSCFKAGDFNFKTKRTLKKGDSFFGSRSSDATTKTAEKLGVFFSDISADCLVQTESNLKNFYAATSEPLLHPNLSFAAENFSELINRIEKNSITFLPLNPPYGLRLSSKETSIALFKSLGSTIQRALLEKSPKILFGFVTCPSEEHWKAILSQIGSGFVTFSTHFTQGGLDIRLLHFLANGSTEF